MKTLFTGNRKAGIDLKWTLPAKKTCRQMGQCAFDCFADDGPFRFSNVKFRHKWNWTFSKTDMFVPTAINELSRKRKLPKTFRIHDGGDFYSLEYLLKWYEIASKFPEVTFYAYTKEVEMIKKYQFLAPRNMTFIFSYGGKQDHLIDPENDRHSLVFESKIDILLSGYADASYNDTIALGENKRIGLCFHHSRKESKGFKNVKKLAEVI